MMVIQERNLRTGLSYLVRYYENGKRVGKSFRTRNEAEAFASVLETTQGMPLNTELTATSLLSTIQFQELCKKLGKSPEDGYKEAHEINPHVFSYKRALKVEKRRGNRKSVLRIVVETAKA